MQETQAQSLGLEDSLEKKMATHSIPSLGNHMHRVTWQANVHGISKEADMT